VKNWNGFTSVDWAADSKGLFVTSNPAGLRQSLLYVDLAGNAHQIWQTNNIRPSWVVPSRNGKYVAIPALTADSKRKTFEATGYQPEPPIRTSLPSGIRTSLPSGKTLTPTSPS
jgi:hypothetical protein